MPRAALFVAPTLCLSPRTHRRVAITTPPLHAPRLLQLLPPARPLWLPTIRTPPLSDPAPLHAALLDLPAFDVLAFTSRVGMRAVFAALQSVCAGDAAAAAAMLRASGTRVAALGADAAAARDLLGVTADVVPLEASPAGLVAFMAADDALRGAAVLCPVPLVVGMREPPVVPRFLHALREGGFRVTAVGAYETRPVQRKVVEFELGAVLAGRADAIVFTSSGEAYALAGIMTEEERARFAALVEEGDLLVVAHGPYTAEGVREAMGVQNVLVSEKFESFQGIIDVLEGAFAEMEAEKGELLLPT